MTDPAAPRTEAEEIQTRLRFDADGSIWLLDPTSIRPIRLWPIEREASPAATDPRCDYRCSMPTDHPGPHLFPTHTAPAATTLGRYRIVDGVPRRIDRPAATAGAVEALIQRTIHRDICDGSEGHHHGDCEGIAERIAAEINLAAWYVPAASQPAPALDVERLARRLREALANLYGMVEESGPDFVDSDAMVDARTLLDNDGARLASEQPE